MTLRQLLNQQKFNIPVTDADRVYFLKARKEYLTDTAKKVSLLMTHLEKDTGILDLRRLAHSLKGTGAAYGFPFVSEIAFCLEKGCQWNTPTVQTDDILRDLVLLFSDAISYFQSVDHFEPSADLRSRFNAILDRTETMSNSGERPLL